jgi:hypothetical protein
VRLTVDQVLALAPDAGAASAAKKLGEPHSWRGVARNDRALWGECQGSALYRVRVDVASLTGKCTCPSRKVPCKHVLGLMLVAAQRPIPSGDEPAWVTEWLQMRTATAERKATRAANEGPVDEEARAKRAEQRRVRVEKGIEALELWMRDLVRNGIGSLDAQPPSFWEAQAARLVDAQASGLASRVRALDPLVGGDSWPARLLAAMGRIALLTRAYRRADALDPALQAEVRQRIGWTVPQEEVRASGARITDEWIVVGQDTDLDERLKMQRTWLLGARTRTMATVLQFAVGEATFEEAFVVGTAVAGELAFFPGSILSRALVVTRSTTAPWTGVLPGHEGIAAMLDDVASLLAKQPFLERVAFALCAVVPVCTRGGAFLVDRRGLSLPVDAPQLVRLLALSGGAPIDMAGEWNGSVVRPLSVIVDGTFHPIGDFHDESGSEE